MSAQHTQGPIRYDYEPGYCGELIARDGVTVAVFVDEPSESDARRLVACWNACDGISTENLEDNLTVQELATRYNAVLAQRDALLEFAKEVRRTGDTRLASMAIAAIANAGSAA